MESHTCHQRNITKTTSTYLGLSPLPVRVTTRSITFLVGNPYKPSFPLLLGGGTTQYIPLGTSNNTLVKLSLNKHPPHSQKPAERQGKLIFQPHCFRCHVGLSKNRGGPKSSILIGFFIINHPFWGTTIFGNTHVSFREGSDIAHKPARKSELFPSKATVSQGFSHLPVEQRVKTTPPERGKQSNYLKSQKGTFSIITGAKTDRNNTSMFRNKHDDDWN